MKHRCHSHLAWSEVRWIVGVAPESCFSHALSASVSSAIHLLCPGASPCPLPPQGLLTKATEAAFFPAPHHSDEKRLLHSVGIFFYPTESREEKKNGGTLDKPSCYCHFLLNKPCSSQLNVLRRFLFTFFFLFFFFFHGRVHIQRPLLD